MNNQMPRLVRAIVLSILFFVTLFSLAGSERGANPAWVSVHSWAGGLMLLGSVGHLVSQRKWIRAVFSRPAKELARRVRRNRNTDLGLAISGAICAVTALVWVLVPAARESLDRPHTMSGLVMVLLIGVHLLLHWRWLVNTLRKLGERSDKAATFAKDMVVKQAGK